MIQTVEAVVGPSGRVPGTMLDEPAEMPTDTALLSEQSLAEGWNRREEDTAWQHLQPGKSAPPRSMNACC